MNLLAVRGIKLIVLLLSLCLCNSSYGQKDNKSWPGLPGFGPESPLTLTSEPTFYGVIGAAALSYVLSEYIGKNHKNIHFYQFRLSANNEHFWGHRHVISQNIGVENRTAPWFGFTAEFNLQQWIDNTPNVSADQFGIGAGVMTYYRWYVLGQKRISPYIEYGTGLFYGFTPFPYNGSNFTFNHSTQLGIEVSLKNNDRVKIGYGHFHQSNNGFLPKNPGYDANGFSISYSRCWHSD